MPAPDRVALLTNFIPPYRLPVLRELGRQYKDFQVFISTPMEAGREWAPEWSGVPVRVQRSLTWHSTWRHPQNFTEPLAIQLPYDTIPQLARFDPDVIISGELGLRTMQAAAFASFSRRRRLVAWATLSEATEQGRGSLRPLLRRALLRMADAVIVNGGSGAHYIRRFGIEPEKLFRVPQTTDVGLFLGQPAVRTTSVRRRLLYSGRLIELKGLIPFVSHLAEWAARNPEKTVEFCIAGDGPLRGKLSQFPSPPNLKLEFLGHVSYDRLPEIYAGAGILAFPSLADEWGLVAVEAMASGLPVLGSLYSQAVEDLVKDGFNGWTFRPDHASEVQSALNRALGAPLGTLNEMAARARSTVKEMTPARMARQIMDAVDYACAPGAPAPAGDLVADADRP